MFLLLFLLFLDFYFPEFPSCLKSWREKHSRERGRHKFYSHTEALHAFCPKSILIYTKSEFIHTHNTHAGGEKVNVFSFLSLITINIDSVRIIDKLEKDLFWRRVIDGQDPERSEIVTLHHVTQKQFAFQSRWCRAKYDTDEWSKKTLSFFSLHFFKQFVFVVENDRSRHCWAPISFYVPPHNNLIVQLPPIKRNQNPNFKSKL